MESEVLQSREREPIIQFSVFADNKVGRLNELIQRLSQQDIHIIALSQLDSTECTIMRIIPDYPEIARRMLKEFGYVFSETPMLAAEISTEADLKFLTSALVEAEINIHYLYPFIMRPGGKSAIALNVEDAEFAETVLQARQIRCLTRDDVAR